MSAAVSVLRYQARDLLRSRALGGYAAFVLVSTWGLIHFGGGTARALPSLATLVVLVVPLVSILVATSFVYRGQDFTELLLAHPVGRGPLFLGIWLGLAAPLAAAFVVGAGLPLALGEALSSHAGPVGLLVLAGVLLSTAFTSIGVLVALRVRDAAPGLGLALAIWLALAILYDGVVLFVTYRWSAYPLEVPVLALMALNPVDVARILIVTALDASAMMGYTGAVFQDFFGSGLGVALAIGCLAAWTLAPFLLALRAFRRRDF